MSDTDPDQIADDVRTPFEWTQITGILVVDPDGWDRRGISGPGSWGHPITRVEFIKRAMMSTVIQWPAQPDHSDGNERDT